MTTAAEYEALADRMAIRADPFYAFTVHDALREAAQLAEEKHRVPTAALIEVWAALFGPARVDEFGTWFNKHGYEAAWGRLLGGIREKVSYADNLEAANRALGPRLERAEAVIAKAKAELEGGFHSPSESVIWDLIAAYDAEPDDSEAGFSGVPSRFADTLGTSCRPACAPRSHDDGSTEPHEEGAET